MLRKMLEALRRTPMLLVETAPIDYQEPPRVIGDRMRREMIQSAKGVRAARRPSRGSDAGGIASVGRSCIVAL